jgi:DNA-binding MarR family transcriptional regulator
MGATLGVTGPQRIVVRIIGKFPGISAGALAKILHIHPSTLTGILKRLEERGAIVRKGAATDARRAELDLSAKGRQIDRCQVGTVEGVIRRVLVRLQPAQIEAAKEVLGIIADELAGL